MIAVIYARKSTEQNVSDEEKSVTRQVEHARAYAVKKGWTVAEERLGGLTLLEGEGGRNGRQDQAHNPPD